MLIVSKKWISRRCEHRHEWMEYLISIAFFPADTSLFFPVRCFSFSPIFFTVNMMAMFILSRGRCGLSKCITRYLMAMATEDLMVVLCKVTLHHTAAIYWRDTFIFYTPVCRIILFLSPIAIDISVWFTVAFTFDRFVAICCHKLKTIYYTGKCAVIVINILNLLIHFEKYSLAFCICTLLYIWQHTTWLFCLCTVLSSTPMDSIFLVCTVANSLPSIHFDPRFEYPHGKTCFNSQSFQKETRKHYD